MRGGRERGGGGGREGEGEGERGEGRGERGEGRGGGGEEVVSVEGLSLVTAGSVGESLTSQVTGRPLSFAALMTAI